MQDQDYPTHTPWGQPDEKRILAAGVVYYDTPSHGGYYLAAERNACVPAALREPHGWYEHDCAWAKVAYAFPDLFSEADRSAARTTLKCWYPDGWESVTGEVLQPGESYIKDERLFREAHANDWIVVSAITSKEHPGMVECVALKGGRDREGRLPRAEERHFLVPQTDYAARDRFGFVIDPSRHAVYDGPSSFASYATIDSER